MTRLGLDHVGRTHQMAEHTKHCIRMLSSCHTQTHMQKKQALRRTCVSPRQHHSLVVHVLRSQLHADGHATQLPVVVLPAWRVVGAVVGLHAHAGALKRRLEGLDLQFDMWQQQKQRRLGV